MKIKDFYTKKLNKLDKNINLYVCGPTVYDYPHIGNVRPVIIFDVFNRVASIKHNINYTHNITDIDDKITKKALEEEKKEIEISTFFEKIYLENLKELNIIIPNNMPRVTENIKGIIKFINLLIKKEFAYEVNNSVYFSIKKLNSYGKIANLKIENLQLKDEFSDDKKNQLDFALWKKTTKGISFNSQWGEGRPGWHTECVFFIKKIYGNNGIDIHAGGIDLKFPHHINEMAQYLAITENRLAKNWVYIGHVNLNKEKMSKSLGNIIRVNDFISKYSPNILRIFLTQVSYSKPVDLNKNSIVNAKKIIKKIENGILKAISLLEITKLQPLEDAKIISILENNLDIPKAYSHIFELIRKINNIIDIEENYCKLFYSLNLLGIKFNLNEENIFKYKKALEKKDYKLSDNLRKNLIKI